MADKRGGKRMADDGLGAEHKRKKTSPRVDADGAGGAASVPGVAPEIARVLQTGTVP